MKVKLKQRNPENPKEWIEKEIYIDGYLKSNLDLGIKLLQKDFDQVWFIDGGEGFGKTNLGITCAYYVSPEERRHTLLDRVCTKTEEADKVILEAKKFDGVVIDEAFGGMSATGFMSRLNRLLQRRFTEIRAKNLFVFVIAPSFMDISRYFAIWRSSCLLHVSCRGLKRGFGSFFNFQKKLKLYDLGRKRYYDYKCVKPNFIFRFLDEAPKLIDMKEYNKKKTYSNLEEPQEDILQNKEIKKQLLVRLNIIKPSLSQKQKAQFFGTSTRTIQRYAKELGNKKI